MTDKPLPPKTLQTSKRRRRSSIGRASSSSNISRVMSMYAIAIEGLLEQGTTGANVTFNGVREVADGGALAKAEDEIYVATICNHGSPFGLLVFQPADQHAGALYLTYSSRTGNSAQPFFTRVLNDLIEEFADLLQLNFGGSEFALEHLSGYPTSNQKDDQGVAFQFHLYRSWPLGNLILFLNTNSVRLLREAVPLGEVENRYEGRELDLPHAQEVDRIVSTLLDNFGASANDQVLEAGELIDQDNTDEDAHQDRRWAILDDFAASNPGKPISSFAKRLFKIADTKEQKAGEPDVPPLPKRPPATWSRDRKTDENPAQFAARVYRTWMDAGVLTRPSLKALDPKLFATLDNWLKHNRRKTSPSPMPEGFRLLTIEQANDAWVARVMEGKAGLPTEPGELERFALALRYRQRTKGRD